MLRTGFSLYFTILQLNIYGMYRILRRKSAKIAGYMYDYINNFIILTACLASDQ